MTCLMCIIEEIFEFLSFPKWSGKQFVYKHNSYFCILKSNQKKITEKGFSGKILEQKEEFLKKNSRKIEPFKIKSLGKTISNKILFEEFLNQNCCQRKLLKEKYFEERIFSKKNFCKITLELKLLQKRVLGGKIPRREY